MNTEAIDKRLVLQYDDGIFTFRRLNHAAGIANLVELALAINAFQADEVRRVLLVTAQTF